MEAKFIVDINVGKLAKWLRVMGYDALIFRGKEDDEMIKIALSQGRVVLTRDGELMKRRVVITGRLKAVLVKGEDALTQLRQIVKALNLDYRFRPFSICLECNQALLNRDREEVGDLVPPYIFRTQTRYMECPSCHRIYWPGTHWQAMNRELEKIMSESN